MHFILKLFLSYTAFTLVGQNIGIHYRHPKSPITNTVLTALWSVSGWKLLKLGIWFTVGYTMAGGY
jgi:hypothetical protein